MDLDFLLKRCLWDFVSWLIVGIFNALGRFAPWLIVRFTASGLEWPPRLLDLP
jgi:hypothetical protein